MIQYHYIAGQTPLNNEEKQGLIPTLLTHADLNRFEQDNILKARLWLMQPTVMARHNIFTESFLTTLHKHMFSDVWQWAGNFRKTNKNIGVEFPYIITELYMLLDDAKYWLRSNTHPIEELAIIFHHRLVKIHLFPNGNGRHARLCADIIAEKYKGERLNWGRGSDLSKPELIRKNYIAALREADAGNYKPLIEFAKS